MAALYTVKTTSFEGPLDLLLELVSKRKLFVNDLSLAEVTDDFVNYISLQEDYSLSESAEFILVASTLLLIKSRSLLPNLPLTEEEEESIHDLEERLSFYARVKELSDLVKPLFGQRTIFEKEPRKSEKIVFSPDSQTNPEALLSTLNDLLESLPKAESLPKLVVKKVVSLEEMIEKLAERIASNGKLRFHDIKHKDKISMIVGFLAMLELVKRGAIRAVQDTHGHIEIEKEELAIPNYSN